MTRLELEQLTTGIGKGLAQHVPAGHAFVFILAETGDSGPGNVAYLSSGRRADIVDLLRDMADRLDHGGAS